MFAKTRIFLEMIKFEHTIFALPFAYVGALLAAYFYRQDPHVVFGWNEFFWITMAMVGARTAAMALNRVIDVKIDSKNPRTADRALPAKKITKRTVWMFALGSIALLLYAAGQLNTVCLLLSPIAVFFLVTYAYTKRFTWLCHYYLGVTIAIAPLGGWLAITGSLDWTAYVLFAAVALWIAGFDILYASQDADFDREEGLNSIPSRFGIGRALWIARFSHLLMFLALCVLYWATPLSWYFLIGLVITAILLIYQHSIVSEHDLSRLNQAFFMMNGLLSIAVFVCTLLDVVILYEF